MILRHLLVFVIESGLYFATTFWLTPLRRKRERTGLPNTSQAKRAAARSPMMKQGIERTGKMMGKSAQTNASPKQIARTVFPFDAQETSSTMVENPALFCSSSAIYNAACCSSSVPAGRGPISCERCAISSIMFVMKCPLVFKAMSVLCVFFSTLKKVFRYLVLVYAIWLYNRPSNLNLFNL